MADNEKYLIRLHGKDIEVSEDVYYAYFQMARQERTQDEKLQRNHVVSYDAMDNEGMVGAEAFEDPILLRDFDITDEMMISAFMLESVSFAAPYPVGVTSDMLECFEGELMLKEQSPDRQWLGQIGDIGEELWVYSKTRELLTDDVDHQYLSDSLADVRAGQACFYVYLWYNFNTNRKDGCTMGVIGIILGNIKNMRQAKKLRALGRDGLLALDDEALYDAAVCMSRDGVIEIDDPRLPEQLVNIYALTQFEAEVNNGGLCQFFVNSSGECAPYVSRALAAAGADGLKTLYERFLRENGIDPKDLSSFKLRSVAEYEDQVARFDYDSFDDAFYADCSIHTQIIAYIRDNVEVLL